MWKIIYSHGRDGHPWDDQRIDAIKRQAERFSIEMNSISYDENDSVPLMISKAQEFCAPDNVATEKLILFGSSRGAFIAAAVSDFLFRTNATPPAGLFMMAPAIGIKPHYYPCHFPIPHAHNICAIHPYGDEVVPFQNAVDFCAKQKITLHLVEDTHILHNQVDFIEDQVKIFLNNIVENSN